MEFESPLVSRYASREMVQVVAPRTRARLWRRLWLALARAQRDLGVPIPDVAIVELEAHQDDVDLSAVDAYERTLRHDVMAHVHHLGDLAPAARPWIHLGATSCFVTDNSDLVMLRDGLDVLRAKLAGAIASLASFARIWADTPTLGYTHLQPAQPTTIGKRACLWIADLLVDLERLGQLRDGLRLRGVKGATGTQDSFLALFDGDHDKVLALDAAIAAAFDFGATYAVTGQTYSRKVDHDVVAGLGSLGVSLHRIGTDLRLLAHLGEVQEHVGSQQIGSSAMPYKRNPMRAERLCALARHLIVLPQDTAMTAATQWLERTLDDSANRRIVLPDALLAADGALRALGDVASGLDVHPKIVARNLAEKLPYLASERFLVAMVRRGADRQEAHERLRLHARASAGLVEDEGLPDDFLDRVANDAWFAAIHEELPLLLDPRALVGRAPEQARAFLDGPVADALRPWLGRLPQSSEPGV